VRAFISVCDTLSFGSSTVALAALADLTTQTHASCGRDGHCRLANTLAARVPTHNGSSFQLFASERDADRKQPDSLRPRGLHMRALT
jgi:hypothetical protein